jgi:hypothetical protein
MNLPNLKYVHSGKFNQNSRHNVKTVVWTNVKYSMHLYFSDSGGINRKVNEMKKARNDWKVAVHVGESFIGLVIPKNFIHQGL